MFHSLWLRNWLGVAGTRKDRRRSAARNRKTVRLMLESLEDRLTPSATVQTAGSYAELANAVAADTAANTSYVIQITQSFQFNAGDQVTISKLGAGSTLTIEGQNGSNYTLTGNGNRLFTVGSGQNVIFDDLTLTGGSGVSSGGAIENQGGNVTLSNVTVKGNAVTGANAEGGGIYVSGGGNLTIQGGSVLESNSALGTNNSGGNAQGGGVYFNSSSNGSTLVIRDSTFDNNSAQGGKGANGATPGAAGGNGGEGDGGGVFVTGSGWDVTLIGDTFLDNSAIGGVGGNGAAGSNATASNSSGGTGGAGGEGGSASGGAADFVVSSTSGAGIGTLTILNDSNNPSTMIQNSVVGGSGGSGGAGGTSTGTAGNSDGGAGGDALDAEGGALAIESDVQGTITVNIGNTTFYANVVAGGNGGAGGAAGKGGSGTAGTVGTNQIGGAADGGGVSLEPAGGTITMVNSTVAKNSDTAGLDGDGKTLASTASGSGIYDDSPATVILDNNTITQNTITGALSTAGAGITIAAGNPTLLNNLIQGDSSIGSSNPDLAVVNTSTPLSNASNNFISSISPNAVSSTSNIIGNSQIQLGSVVGVDSNNQLTGGPIYYPLLSGVASIGAGTTSDLSTIAGVEGTTSANAVDEIGYSRSGTSSIDLGAVQYQPLTQPSGLINPSSQTVMAGSSVSFTASASGYPAPTVQWQVSTDGGKTFTNISGATSTTLTLNNVSLALNGFEYRAVFTNSLGSATTSAAILTVQTAPAITSGNSAVFTVGQGGSFVVTTTGSPTPSLTISGALPSGVTFHDNGNGTGILEGAPAAGTNGTYTVTIVAHNGAGSDAVQSFTLTVSPASVVTASTPPFVPPVLKTPFLLHLFDLLLGGVETINANDTETMTDSLFGIPLLVSNYDSSGNLTSVTFLGFNVTFLFA
jgi:hypothetical protein